MAVGPLDPLTQICNVNVGNVDLERPDIQFVHCSADFRDVQNLALGDGRGTAEMPLHSSAQNVEQASPPNCEFE
jgi:hypothetical protein